MECMQIEYILNKTKVPPVIFGGIFSTFSVDSKNKEYYYNYIDYLNKNNNNNDKNYTKNNKIINNNNNTQHPINNLPSNNPHLSHLLH